MFALPLALLAGWVSTLRLALVATAAPSFDLLASLYAALEIGAPVGACAAACAAVELGWPRRGQRSDFTAALIAFVAGVAAAALASLQVDYARGVLFGGREVLDYTALRLSSLPRVIVTASGLAALLAFGAVPRRRGEPWVVGCLGSIAGVSALLLIAALVMELRAERSTGGLHAAPLILASAWLALVSSLLCAAADGIAAWLVGPTTSRPAEGPPA